MKSLRYRVFRTLTCAAFTLHATAPALAAEEQLKPVSPWYVDWAPSSCTLKRAFGSEKEPSVLSIERFAPGDKFQMYIVSNEIKTITLNTNLNLSYGADANFDYKGYLSLGSVKNKQNVSIPFIIFRALSLSGRSGQKVEATPVTPAIEAAATSLSLRWKSKTLTLMTGPMDKALAALRTCTDNLVQSWGLDPAQQANLSKPPTPSDDPATWVRVNDYPSSMLREGKQALVNFLLLVDAQGKPSSCKVQGSYNDKLFDELSCNLLMKRASFSPALDSEGHPVPSYFSNTITWIVMP